MPTSSRRSTCLQSSARTTFGWRQACGKRTALADEHGDARDTRSLLEVWIDEGAAWFLLRGDRKGDEPGR